MIISFKFDYLNNNGLIAYFLDFYARKSGLKYAIKMDKNLTTLFIDADEKNALEFSDNYMTLIPNSAFLAKSSVEVITDASSLGEICAQSADINTEKFSNFTPSQIREFLENNKIIKNEFGIVSGVSVHNGNEYISVNSENFNELIKYSYRILSHNQDLRILLGDLEITLNANLNFDKSDFVIATGLNSFNKIFIADDKQKIALATYEKPILHLKTNSVFRNSFSHAPKYFDVKMTSDLFTFALFKKLENDDIYYVCARADKAKFLQLCVIDDKFLITKNSEFLSEDEKKILLANDNLAHFGLICKEKQIFDKRVLRLFLSKENNDEIAIYDAKSKRNLMKFAIPQNFTTLENEIKSDEIGARLLANFSTNFSLDYVRKNADFSEISRSFYGYFEIISRVIFAREAEYLLECASEFLGQKGMKLDCELAPNGEFNLAKTLRSAMSYKLAGVDDRVLSFGFIDTLARFIDDLADANTDLYDAGVLIGSLFSERRFANIANALLAKSRLGFSDYLGLEA